MSKRSRALASAVVAAVWRNPSRCSGLLGNTRNTGERVVTDEQALVTYQVAYRPITARSSVPANGP